MTPAFDWTPLVPRLKGVLAHLWMVRTFLKHADEVQARPEFLEVPRELFDAVRAVEPAFDRGDYGAVCRRLRGKLKGLTRLSEFFAANYSGVSPHTNFIMASQSLGEALRTLSELLGPLPPEAFWSPPRETVAADPFADLPDVPEI